MARPREFDDHEVLDSVMRAFWTNGYGATSVDDLCEASGLSRSSLYSAFGDKHALLLRSLEHYIEMRIGRIRKCLLDADTIGTGLAALATQIIDDMIAGPGRRGCFIGNCAAEIARGDRQAMALIRNEIDITEGVFREALARGRSRGELSDSTDIDALSRFFVAGFQGLRLVGKAYPDRKKLQDIAHVMLRCLS